MNYYPSNNTNNINNNHSLNRTSAALSSSALFFDGNYSLQNEISRSRQNSLSYNQNDTFLPRATYYPVQTAPTQNNHMIATIGNHSRRGSSQLQSYIPSTPNRTQIVFNDAPHLPPERTSFVNTFSNNNHNNLTERRLSSRQYDIAQTVNKNFNFVFNETIAGDNMDSVIDTMAKRRIALKRLEREASKMNNQIDNSLLFESNTSTQRHSITQSRQHNDHSLVPSTASNLFHAHSTTPQLIPLPTQPTIIHHHHYYGIKPSDTESAQGYHYQEDASRPISKQIHVQSLIPPNLNNNNNNKGLTKSISLDTENGRLSLTREQLKTPTIDNSNVLHTTSFFNNKFNSNHNNNNNESFNINDKRNLFWSSAVIIRFFLRIRNEAFKKKLISRPKSSSTAIFRIRLMEIMTALHRVYLEPAGPIYLSIIQVVKSHEDFSHLLLNSESTPQYDACIHLLCQYVDNIISKITEFMPKEGILGTNRNSALISLFTNGNRYPDNYFWECEKELLEFDSNGKLNKINNEQTILLFIGNVFSRGLITTLLVKPIKFRLVRGELTQLQENNLKLVSTLLIYIVRKSSSSTKMLKFPLEWQDSFYNDTKMSYLYANMLLKKTLDMSRAQLTKWSQEYIKRLQAYK